MLQLEYKITQNFFVCECVCVGGGGTNYGSIPHRLLRQGLSLGLELTQ